MTCCGRFLGSECIVSVVVSVSSISYSSVVLSLKQVSMISIVIGRVSMR